MKTVYTMLFFNAVILIFRQEIELRHIALIITTMIAIFWLDLRDELRKERNGYRKT